MPTRIGVVGAGAHSTRQHGPALQQCAEERSKVELTAVCDLSAERAEQYADEFGFRATYTTVDQLYAEENLDALVAVSPTDAIRELVGDLLTRGVPILLEKPPGRTETETRELRDIASEHDTRHMISFNRRFNPAVVRAREFLANWASPKRIMAHFDRVGRLESDHVFSTGIHPVDLVLSFLSPPKRVVSRRWRSRDAGGESCEALLTCANGDAATVLMTPDAGTHREEYVIVGPQYTVRIDVADPRVEGFVAGERRFVWTIKSDAPTHERVGGLAETRAFLDAVEGRRVFSPDLNDGLTTVRTAVAIDSGGRQSL